MLFAAAVVLASCSADPADTVAVAGDRQSTESTASEVAEPAISGSTAPEPTASTTSTTEAPEPPAVIVAGDSIIYDVAPGLSAALEPAGGEVLSMVTPSLASESSRTALHQQIGRTDPDYVVVMVGVWERAHVTASGFKLGDPGFAAEYVAEALDPLAGQLAAIEAHLLILGPPHIRVASDDAQIAALEAIWSDYARGKDSIEFIDSDHWLIDSDVFVAIDDDGADPVRLRRIDGLHLCAEGARRITAGILAQLPVDPAPGWETGPWIERFPADECPPPV